ETDGTGPLRQLGIQGIELQVDVAELPLRIGDALVQLNGHKRIAGERYGFDAVVRVCSRMNGLILGRDVLNSTGNVLFDLLSCSAGPRTSRHPETYGNVRVLTLRHRGVAEITPNQHAQKKDPGDVRMLDKELWNIPATSDVFLVFVCHLSQYSYGRT